MTAPAAPPEILPRPAPAWAALIVFALLCAGGWAVADPAGPLPQLRVSEQVGPLSACGRWWFLAPVLAVAGVTALGGLAVADYLVIRRWARQEKWQADALAWCGRRLLAMQTEEHLKAEVGVAHERLADALARRWGKYYAAAFALLLAVGLLSVVAINTSDPTAALPPLLYPLAGVTAGLLVTLLVVVAAARYGSTTLKAWREDQEEAVAVASRESAATDDDDDDGDDGDDDDNGKKASDDDDDPLLGGYSHTSSGPSAADDLSL